MEILHVLVALPLVRTKFTISTTKIEKSSWKYSYSSSARYHGFNWKGSRDVSNANFRFPPSFDFRCGTERARKNVGEEEGRGLLAKEEEREETEEFTY